VKAPAPLLRLDRLLSNLGYGSRKEMQKLAAARRILLDGVPVTDADHKIAIAADLPGRLTVDGQPLDPAPGMVLMLNKPRGMTCSHKEAGALVYDLFPPRWRRRDPPISSIGRLDKDTSGLLLFTDDGELLHRVIAPKSEIAKRYHVTLARPLMEDEAEIFASGTLMLEGDDKPLLPAVLEPISPMVCNVVITEGRYHQVRRMFAAVGNHVMTLHRDRIGGLELPHELLDGEYRLLSEDEKALIFAPG
jgi:16S rRNA pseudouridine516 synthase